MVRPLPHSDETLQHRSSTVTCNHFDRPGLIVSDVMIASWKWFQEAEQLCRDADRGAVWAEISKIYNDGCKLCAASRK
jgi:hypothetical protein